jgi:hypothetical protein
VQTINKIRHYSMKLAHLKVGRAEEGAMEVGAHSDAHFQLVDLNASAS